MRFTTVSNLAYFAERGRSAIIAHSMVKGGGDPERFRKGIKEHIAQLERESEEALANRNGPASIAARAQELMMESKFPEKANPPIFSTPKKSPGPVRSGSPVSPPRPKSHFDDDDEIPF
jgi:hypothetical protein